MNVNEETAALIAEARRWANGHPNRRSGELMRDLADALEARQPSEDDREALIDVVKRNRSVVKRMSDGYPSVAFVTDETIAEAILAAGFSRATVPDAAFYGACGVELCETCLPLFDAANREIEGTAPVPDAATEELLKRVEEAEAQSAEDRVEWQQMKERASQRFNAYQQKKRELRQMEIRAEKAEAERAAALAAIERVRVVAFGHGKGAEDLPVDRDALKAALDGAPEPEVKQ